MLEEILRIDTELFLYLNNLGTSGFDSFWMFLSSKASNIIVYIAFLEFFLRRKGFKSYKIKTLDIIYIVFIVLVMILISDQSANIFKDSFQRLRPCYDELIKDSVRLVKEGCGGKHGFFSAHASNSFSLAVFFGLLFKDFSKYPIYFTLIFASLISYSRVYLGVHYPLDIIFGALFGMINGLVIYSVHERILKSFNLFNKS
tara:strand:- start:28 stop:630 length:603 start_codon:yes stop_codon:yes gene_type:complete